jgi:NAD(P)H-nitrite reductase large subunit
MHKNKYSYIDIFQRCFKIGMDIAKLFHDYIFIGGKMKSSIAVIGNGCAALSAMTTIRDLGCKEPIMIISDSVWQAYNPMLTTYYLAGKIDLEDFFQFDDGTKFYSDNDVNLIMGSPVVHLDAHEKEIKLKNGQMIKYDKCIIATGASPFIPNMEGKDLDNVFAVRTFEDTVKINRFMKQREVKKAVVIGASMVGIKMAEYFNKKGIQCCLADAASSLFPLAAHPACGTILEDIVSEHGINLRFSACVEKIEQRGNKTLVHFLDEKKPEEADIVIMAIGVRPNIDFVDKDQVMVDRGIIVDKKMKTNVEGLYAAGDCAQGYDMMAKENRIIGLLANARYQGRTAAKNLCGVIDEYSGSTPHNITYFLNTDFVGIGDPYATGEIFEKFDRQNKKYIRIVRNQGQIRCVNLINYKEISGYLKNMFFKGLESNSSMNEGQFNYDHFTEELVKKYI